MEMESSPAQYGATPKRTVLGTLNNQGGDSPISPMANLKLLMKVATNPDGRCENLATPLKSQPEPTKIRQCGRQLRSLGHICKKFLDMYPLDLKAGEMKNISLIQLSKDLEIEKRRVYDIINVVASINMASKVCKDRYAWYGNQYLRRCLYELKQHGVRSKLDVLVDTIYRQEQADEAILDTSFKEALHVHSTSTVLEDNRIGVLCQKFIVLFLVSPPGAALNLSVISKLILPSEVPDKTGMRRLYDIANVLESLGIIQRPSGKILRKPTFIYCGPDLNLSEEEERKLSDSVPFHVSSSRKISCGGENSFVGNHMKEGRFYSLSDMLHVVSSELKRISQENLREESIPSAKKRLFPTSDTPTLVKAPNHSFRVVCNRITSPPESAQVVPQTPEAPATILPTCKKEPIRTVNLGKISKMKPIKIFKPIKFNLQTPDIQNGSIYKAVKNGDVIHLVKLSS